MSSSTVTSSVTAADKRDTCPSFPMPNIGTVHPDGAVRRVMLLEPPDGDGEVVELLQLKLSSSVFHRVLENGNGPRKTEPVCLRDLASEPLSSMQRDR
jgi:hypothetical protein